jgi:hypothetical protein
VAATEDALTRQADQLAALSAAWQGGSAELSQDFLRRHGDASAAAAAAVRTAADTLTALRDNLWHTVDGKVAAAIAADDRAPDEWLAAAQTVTTGTGDRAAASERIDQEVKPFVDNDIRTEWLTAMRSAMAAVVDLFDAATAELTAEPDAVFDVPGDLGPAWTPQAPDEGVASVPAAAGIAAPPPVWSAPPAPIPAPMPSPAMPPAPIPAPMPSAPMPAPMPSPALPPVDAAMPAPAMAAPPSTPSLGGMPDIGSGLSGFGQQLADAFGSLLGSTDEALPDTPDIDEPAIDDELDDDDPDDDAENDEDDVEVDEPVETPADADDDEAAVQDPVVGVEDTCEPADPSTPVEPPPPSEQPTPTPVPPPQPALPPEWAPEPMAAAETPCEIAADELPQVGE